MKTQKLRLKHVLFFAFALINVSIYAQEEEKESPFQFGNDFTSRYIWRGIQLGGVSTQPYIEFAKGNFAFGAWGSYSFTGTQTGQEADLYISYTLAEMFTFLITDYYFPDDAASYSYFDYNKSTTGHVIEFAASFNGTDKIPVSFLIATNVYGDDAKKENGTNVFSTYAELTYATRIIDTDLSVFAGFALNAPGTIAGVETPGFYGNTGASFINFGLRLDKELKMNETFSLPVNASLIFNPDAQHIYMSFGFSL